MKARASKYLVRRMILLLSVLMMVSLACTILTTPTPAPPPVEPSPPAQTQPPVQPPPETEEPPAPQEPAATQEPAASGAVNSLKGAKKAIIQIESQGTFVDPQVGLVVNGAGRGSGFIIDPSGLAVTNNHVVTGAALLKVWVGGDTTKTYNAKVLGTSECSDLAVIQIEAGGEIFPYLQWHEGEIEVGTDIYVAGFPLGDPEYTLNKGIVSKAKANGKTNWSSIQSVIEYDATTNPGNSGGPVLDTDGRVMGVHFSSNPQARQAFGISAELAMPLVQQLQNGNSQDTIGINGQAVATEDKSLTGVWVSSVQSGSPAEASGLEPGDIIVMMENLVLATDGTMGEYCDVVRSHKPTDTLSLKAVRWSTKEILEGQVNGKKLEVTGTFGTSSAGSGETTSSSGGVAINANASQPGEIYYSNTFESNLSDWEYFVTRGKEENFTSRVGNGRFRIEINKPTTYLYYLLKNAQFEDVRVDTRVENLGTNTNFVGLICRLSDDGWYEADVNSNGTYSIFFYDRRVSGNRYKLLYSGASRLIRMGKDTNEYTLICKGDNLTLGINGTEVRTVPTKTGNYTLLRSGQSGLTVGSEQYIPLIVEFQKFVLSVP